MRRYFWTSKLKNNNNLIHRGEECKTVCNWARVGGTRVSKNFDWSVFYLSFTAVVPKTVSNQRKKTITEISQQTKFTKQTNQNSKLKHESREKKALTLTLVASSALQAKRLRDKCQRQDNRDKTKATTATIVCSILHSVWIGLHSEKPAKCVLK